MIFVCEYACVCVWLESISSEIDAGVILYWFAQNVCFFFFKSWIEIIYMEADYVVSVLVPFLSFKSIIFKDIKLCRFYVLLKLSRFFIMWSGFASLLVIKTILNHHIFIFHKENLLFFPKHLALSLNLLRCALDFYSFYRKESLNLVPL